MLSHLFPPLRCAAEDRNTIARDLMGQGVSAGRAHESADLALHAASEAVLTLETVTSRASSTGVQFQAFDIALQIVAADLKRKNDSLRALANASHVPSASTPLTLLGDKS